MSKETIKRIALGVLVVVLIGVWSNAFRGGEAESAGYQVRPPLAARQSDSQNEGQLKYVPPKVNPFWRAVERPQEDPGPGRRGARTESIQRVSTGHQLSGVLSRGTASQAVIAGPDGTATVLSIGDLLAGWQLISVTDSRAVFKCGKQQDTLHLYESH